MRISVCMATYNGEKFLAQQISSILKQIEIDDELIIVDDASTDRTVEILNSFIDSRIVIKKLDINLGHVKAFERAISLAKGDIIFLSDQDDVWHSSKCATVVSIFKENSNISMVAHSLISINADGSTNCNWTLWLPNSTLSKWCHLSKELVKARVFGCAMAFRKNVLKLALPFPYHVYAHDHWLSICASFFGEIRLTSNELVFHRLHDSNVTPLNGLVLKQALIVRLKMIKLILKAYLREKNYWRI